MLYRSSYGRELSAILTQRRFKMTGFSIFVRETQKGHHVLKAKSLSEGSKNNMKIMSSLWRKLPKKERVKYNQQASAKQLIKVNDLSKKNSTFNMVMQVFAQDKALVNVGDEHFVARIASRTARALSTNDLEKLMKKLNVKFKPVQKKLSRKCSDSFFRMMFPSMRNFSSFTEMQHAVAPTRQTLYVAFCRILAPYFVSLSGELNLNEKFNSLDSKVKSLFNPISKEESPFFETFCARNCAGFDEEHFNIIILFAQFRQIISKVATASDFDIAIYRSMMASERCHEPVYFKVRRALVCARECRSSDCGPFISHRIPETLAVAPQSYGIHKNFDEVDVATQLAETRQCQSVYDDILDRAAILRPKENQEKLEMYIVKKIREESAASNFLTMKEITKQSRLLHTKFLYPDMKVPKISSVSRCTSKQSKLPIMLELPQLTDKSNAGEPDVDSPSLITDGNHIADTLTVKQRNARRSSKKYHEVLEGEGHHDELNEPVFISEKSKHKKQKDVEYEDYGDDFSTDACMHMLDGEAETWDSLDLPSQNMGQDAPVSVEENSISISEEGYMDKNLTKKSGTRRILRSARVQDDVMLDSRHSIIFKHKHKPNKEEIVGGHPQLFPTLEKGSIVKLLKGTAL